MDILNNTLVRKYFRCREHTWLFSTECFNCSDSAMSYRVISAMQEPIKKGEKYLFWISSCHGLGAKIPESYFEEWTCGEEQKRIGVGYIEDNFDSYHPQALRLPDRFQKRECPERITCECGMAVLHPDPGTARYQTQHDEVTEKIDKLCRFFCVDKSPASFKEELCELVRLAREGK